MALAGVLLAVLAALPRPVAAEDRVTVSGNYYREVSTRVLQPTVDVTVDVPDERLTLGASYVLDAISSASIATGTTAVTGGDNVFTEIRHETAVHASSRLGAWGVGGFFRYSTETDYISRSLGASASRELLQRTITLSLSYAYNFDRVFRIVNATGARAPHCGGTVDVAACSDDGAGLGTNLLQTHYVAAGYAHVLHKYVLGLLTTEIAHSRGPQDNPYRGAQILGVENEMHPLVRTRVALAPGLRIIVPRGGLVFEPRYRFNADSWEIRAHAPELRVHWRFAKHFRLRLRYRYYRQNQAFFWRDDGNYTDGPGRCTPDAPTNCASADPKMDGWDSHTPGGQIVWELDGIAKFRGLAWTENGWISATYNHVFQNNRFGNARLGTLAFSLAF